MELQLNGQIVDEVIQQRFDGRVENLLGHWTSLRPDNDDTAWPEAPTLSTIYRWISGETCPRSMPQLLTFAAVLDIDPALLVTVPDGEARTVLYKISYMFWTQNIQPPAFRFLNEFYGHKREWPPTNIATTYFGREWVVHGFEHRRDRRRSYYAQIELTRGLSQSDDRPQVFHFAYRHPNQVMSSWIQYGHVEASGLRTRLMNINSDAQSYKKPSPSNSELVETYFGEADTDFLVASLHPFELKLQETERTGERSVRFTA